MLRMNLSTRPFYNLRAIHVALGVAGMIVLAVTLFNIVQVVRLGMSQQWLSARAVETEGKATQLRADAARILAEINPQELQAVSNAAREANKIIDQRAFSWTVLLTQFEATLPPDVRITAVRPQLERKNGLNVAIRVEARRAEDLDVFVEALETDGAFHDVLVVQAQTSVRGVIEALVEGIYMSPSGNDAVGPPELAVASP